MTVVNYMNDCLGFVKINGEELMESALDQAEKYAVVAEAHQKTYLQAANLKNKKNILEAQLDEKIRSFHNTGVTDGAADAKTKVKLTETQIQAKIQADESYIRLINSCNEADSYLAFANNILEAMRQRHTSIDLLYSNSLCSKWME
jgi:hypothetical protein